MENGLYWLDLFRVTDKSALMSKKKVSIEHWHMRLGHLSFSGINELVQKKMVEGIDCKSTDFASKNKICESCFVGKQSSMKFKSKDEQTARGRPLRWVHGKIK